MFRIDVCKTSEVCSLHVLLCIVDDLRCDKTRVYNLFSFIQHLPVSLL